MKAGIRNWLPRTLVEGGTRSPSTDWGEIFAIVPWSGSPGNGVEFGSAVPGRACMSGAVVGHGEAKRLVGADSRVEVDKEGVEATAFETVLSGITRGGRRTGGRLGAGC